MGSIKVKWNDPKKQLPKDDAEVLVQTGRLFKTRKFALFIENSFMHRGEDITHWVTHWMKVKKPTYQI